MTELTEVPGRYTNVAPVPRVLWHRRRTYRSSGTGMNVVQNSRKFRVRVIQYSQKFRIRYGSLTELTEFPGRYANEAPVPWAMWHGRTEPSEASGTGIDAKGEGNTRVNTRLKGAKKNNKLPGETNIYINVYNACILRLARWAYTDTPN